VNALSMILCVLVICIATILTYFRQTKNHSEEWFFVNHYLTKFPKLSNHKG
jgi:hypothetical protein